MASGSDEVLKVDALERGPAMVNQGTRLSSAGDASKDEENDDEGARCAEEGTRSRQGERDRGPDCPRRAPQRKRMKDPWQ